MPAVDYMKLKGYKDEIRKIQAVARRKGVHPSQVAARFLEPRRGELSSFVIKYGMNPADDILQLAAQVATIHERNVEVKMTQLGDSSYELAEDSVFQDYALQGDAQGYDNFDFATLGAVFQGAVSGVKKINATRAEKGKPPLLAGKKKKALFAKTQEDERRLAAFNAANKQKQQEDEDNNIYVPDNDEDEKPPAAKKKSGVRTIIDEVTGKVKKKEEEKALKEYLPFIIGGAILIFFLGKKS